MSTENSWPRALERFEEAYGGPADLDDPTDRAALLTLLAEAVRDGIARELARHFEEGTAELRAELAELD